VKVNIRCNTGSTLALPELSGFQGGLKDRAGIDVDRIAGSIKEFGFAFPFFIWRDNGTNNIIDGHGRVEALMQLESEGYEIPSLPVVYVGAENVDKAKELLLSVNSLYGKLDRDALLALIEETGADIEGLSFPQVTFNFGGAFEPSLYPEIDTSDVDDDDIGRASERLNEVNNGGEMIEFTCRCCGAGIYIKREVISRYLRGEYV